MTSKVSRHPTKGKCFNCKKKQTDFNFCFGCKNFVCDECDSTMPSGPHEPKDHLSYNGDLDV